MNLPLQFIEQMKAILGNEYSDFESSLHDKLPISIRINPFKTENDLILSDPVAWCTNAYYLNERPSFTLDPFFHAGHYYVQEAASMFIDFILKSIELPIHAKILDMCSAPGGKSTLMLANLSQDTLLHCHEFEPLRANVLRQNIERWGYSNTIITQGSLDKLERSDIKYDLILIDAPCSGEGMFRKEKEAINQWNQNKINNCVHMQNQILRIADKLCAENGYIIYSTCTYNTKENEAITNPYLENEKYTSVNIKNDFSICEPNSKNFTYRFFPHKSKGEGFTVSVLKKQEAIKFSENSNYVKKSKIRPSNNTTHFEWLSNPDAFSIIGLKDSLYAISNFWADTIQHLMQIAPIYYAGIPIGQFKGKDFYPAHGLSQSNHFSKNIELSDLEFNQAINFLKSNAPEIAVKQKSKWAIASYRSANLGWLKSNSNGLKNYFPKNQRIISF
ncbi:MAG: hypothetical protein IPG12_13885 [Saprospiraceae bacterium]|nr:hypothetical protein [Saprospiraceae bacterium]